MAANTGRVLFLRLEVAELRRLTNLRPLLPDNDSGVPFLIQFYCVNCMITSEPVIFGTHEVQLNLHTDTIHNNVYQCNCGRTVMIDIDIWDIDQDFMLSNGNNEIDVIRFTYSGEHDVIVLSEEIACNFSWTADIDPPLILELNLGEDGYGTEDIQLPGDAAVFGVRASWIQPIEVMAAQEAGNGGGAAVNGGNQAVNGGNAAVNGGDQAVNHGANGGVATENGGGQAWNHGVNGGGAAVNGGHQAVNGGDQAVNHGANGGVAAENGGGQAWNHGVNGGAASENSDA